MKERSAIGVGGKQSLLLPGMSAPYPKGITAYQPVEAYIWTERRGEAEKILSR